MRLISILLCLGGSSKVLDNPDLKIRHVSDVLLHAIIKSNRGLLIPYRKEQHSTVSVKEWLLKQKPSPYQFAEESGADKAKQWEP